jgi:DNA-binding transcriptional LysR family regulator
LRVDSLSMNWDNIRYFLAYVRTGSLIAAARMLATSPATVSRRISTLEEEVGVPLLQRLPHGMVLTPGANRLVDIWTAAEQLLHGAPERVSALPDGLSPRIRFSTTPSLAHGLVFPELHRFRAQWPRVQLELDTSVKTIDIGAGEGDVAMRFTRPERGNLLRQQVGRMAFGVYCAKTLANNKPTDHKEWGTLADLSLPIVTWTASFKVSPSQSALEAALDGQAPTIAINEFSSLLAAITGGVGMGLLPCLVGDKLQGVTRLAGPDLAGWTDMWLVTAKPIAHYPHVVAFRQFLLACVKDKQGELNPFAH